MDVKVSGGAKVDDGNFSSGSTVAVNIGAAHTRQHERSSIGADGYDHVKSHEEGIGGVYNASSYEQTTFDKSGTLTETRAEELNIGGVEVLGCESTSKIGPDGIEGSGEYTFFGQTCGYSCDCGCPSCSCCSTDCLPSSEDICKTITDVSSNCFSFFEGAGSCISSTFEAVSEVASCIGSLIPE